MDSPVTVNDSLPSLLQDGEAPAFQLFNGDGHSPILILCDHASNRIPECLGDMGLNDEDFEKHIAYDIGGEDVARNLAERLDCAALIAGYSRLIIDLNRHPGDGSSIPEISDEIEIPANHQLTPEQIIRRENTFFWPYHNAVTEQLNHIVARGDEPMIIAVHSVTPSYRGYQRPWHIGVLWDQDQRLSQPLLESLRQEPGLCVGDNEPYHARHPLGFTMDVHCERNGYPHVLLEIRQDLINDKEKANHWAGLIERHLQDAFTQTGLLTET